MDSDYPNVRASFSCVCCGKIKTPGLVLCWPCHHAQKLHNDGDYYVKTKRRLAFREHSLEEESHQ